MKLKPKSNIARKRAQVRHKTATSPSPSPSPVGRSVSRVMKAKRSTTNIRSILFGVIMYLFDVSNSFIPNISESRAVATIAAASAAGFKFKKRLALSGFDKVPKLTQLVNSVKGPQLALPTIPAGQPILQLSYHLEQLARLNIHLFEMITNEMRYASFVSLLTTVRDPSEHAMLASRRSRVRFASMFFSPSNIRRNTHFTRLRQFWTDANLPELMYGPRITFDADKEFTIPLHEDKQFQNQVLYFGAGLRTLEILGHSWVIESFRRVVPNWPCLTRVTICQETHLNPYSIVLGLRRLPNLVHLHVTVNRFKFNPNDRLIFLNEAWLNRLESLYLASSVPMAFSIVDFASNPALQSVQHLGLVNIQDGLAYMARPESLGLRARLETVLVRGAEQSVRPIQRDTFTRTGVVFKSSII